jgi:hypothetical protein
MVGPHRTVAIGLILDTNQDSSMKVNKVVLHLLLQVSSGYVIQAFLYDTLVTGLPMVSLRLAEIAKVQVTPWPEDFST